MEVRHPVFYASLGHMQNSMRISVTLKLKLALTLTLTLTDTGGAVLTLMLGYRPGGVFPFPPQLQSGQRFTTCDWTKYIGQLSRDNAFVYIMIMDASRVWQ